MEGGNVLKMLDLGESASEANILWNDTYFIIEAMNLSRLLTTANLGYGMVCVSACLT